MEVDGVSELEPLAVLFTSRQLGQQPPHLQKSIQTLQVTNLSISTKLHLSPHCGPELVPGSPLVHCRGHGQASAVTIDSEWLECASFNSHNVLMFLFSVHSWYYYLYLYYISCLHLQEISFCTSHYWLVTLKRISKLNVFFSSCLHSLIVNITKSMTISSRAR